MTALPLNILSGDLKLYLKRRRADTHRSQLKHAKLLKTKQGKESGPSFRPKLKLLAKACLT
jgi:hypothetical protein